MTPQDVKADALVTSAMQSSLTMLEAGSSEQCEASVELLQHLVPLHKHLTLLQRWLEVRASCSSVSTKSCISDKSHMVPFLQRASSMLNWDVDPERHLR